MCLVFEFKASRHQADLHGWFLFYYFELVVQLYGIKGMEGRGGGKGLLVASDTASCLLCALPEPRHADLYSEHAPNKCQSTKGGNARFALGILFYTEKGIAFVCLFKLELTSLGSWPRGRCDHTVLKVWIFQHTGERHSTSLLGKQRPAPVWVLCSARSPVPHAQVPAG